MTMNLIRILFNIIQRDRKKSVMLLTLHRKISHKKKRPIRL